MNRKMARATCVLHIKPMFFDVPDTKEHNRNKPNKRGVILVILLYTVPKYETQKGTPEGKKYRRRVNTLKIGWCRAIPGAWSKL